LPHQEYEAVARDRPCGPLGEGQFRYPIRAVGRRQLEVLRQLPSRASVGPGSTLALLEEPTKRQQQVIVPPQVVEKVSGLLPDERTHL
jgi:hypothetical protein